MARTPFLSRLVDRVVPDVIKRLRGDADDAPAAAATPPAEEEEDSPYLDLEDLLKEDIGAFGGKVHIISLMEFREGIGSARWLKLSKNIMLIAEGVLRSHLGHTHAYVQRGTDMFLLGFRGLGDAQAKMFAIRIAEEIGGRLAGANFGEQQALVRTADIDPEDLIGEDGELDEDVLQDAAAQAEGVPAVVHREPETGGRTWAIAAPQAPQDRRLLPTVDPTALNQPERRYWHAADPGKGDDRRKWATEGAGADYDERPTGDPLLDAARAAAAQPRWQPLIKPLSEAERRDFEARHGNLLGTLKPEDYIRTGGRPEEAEAVPPDDDAEDAPPVALPEPDPEPAVDPAAEKPGACEASFRPCWTASTEAADCFLLRGTLTGGSIPAGETRRPAALHDPLVAARAAEILAAMGEAGVKATLVVPLHVISLADEARRPAVLQALAKAPQTRRMLALRVELIGITANTPAARVMKAVEALRPVVREVALRTDLLTPSRAVFGLKGVLLGTDAEDLKDRTPDRLAAAVHALAHKARLGGATGTFVWGLRKRAEIGAVLAAGADQIGGPAFSKDIPPPGRVVRLPKARLVGP